MIDLIVYQSQSSRRLGVNIECYSDEVIDPDTEFLLEKSRNGEDYVPLEILSFGFLVHVDSEVYLGFKYQYRITNLTTNHCIEGRQILIKKNTGTLLASYLYPVYSLDSINLEVDLKGVTPLSGNFDYAKMSIGISSLTYKNAFTIVPFTLEQSESLSNNIRLDKLFYKNSFTITSGITPDNLTEEDRNLAISSIGLDALEYRNLYTIIQHTYYDKDYAINKLSLTHLSYEEI